MLETRAVDLLILGAGWTSTFLIPQLKAEELTYAATTTSGRDGTIIFRFDASSTDKESYKALPKARTVLITFPLKGQGESELLTSYYDSTHHGANARWIQLGSTGIFQNDGWNNSKSPYDRSNARGVAEDALLSCTKAAAVLNLAGLYDDHVRRPQNWVSRVAKSKADVKAKKSLHLIHGKDVARAIIACHKRFEAVQGRRWIITDLFVYDWWTLLFTWGGKLEDGTDLKPLVLELMQEHGVHALPRAAESLGRALDGKSFWLAVESLPQEGPIA